MELCLLHFVHPSSRMTGWGRNDKKQSFQGHFERNDDQTISHFSSLISVIRGHSDLEWPSNDKIPSFRSHSGMTWDELPFARKISRLLGRAMEGPRNDVEWCRNDVGMMEWQPDDWNDYRMIKYEQGGAIPLTPNGGGGWNDSGMNGMTSEWMDDIRMSGMKTEWCKRDRIRSDISNEKRKKGMRL